jgi:muramoyltetrapeptide carboxypeptidase
VNWVRPRALQPGDTVGVCSPSGPVSPERLDRGLSALRAMGYEVRESPGARARTRFTAGPAHDRLAELHALYADDGVAAIVCARGGAGAAGLMEGLDLELLRSHPKVFVGYSDLTLVHLALGRLGQVSVHGPMVARELADGAFDEPSFAAAVAGRGPSYVSEPEDLMVVRAGEATGVLRGGCLSLLASAAGTAWAFAADEDTLLFLEDVDEAPYRIDRMLWQLRASGAFERVRGVVFGDMRGCTPRFDADFGLEDVIADALAGLDVPIALGLSSGHTNNPFVSLPFGVPARLSCGADARFEVLGPAVS